MKNSSSFGSSLGRREPPAFGFAIAFGGYWENEGEGVGNRDKVGE